MSAPQPIEPYRVILDYEALEDAFLDRIEDLNTTFEQIDAAAGFTRGNTQKLLSKSRERWARTLGHESMGKMLKGTGMALVLVINNEQFAAVKAELAPRRRPMLRAGLSMEQFLEDHMKKLGQIGGSKGGSKGGKRRLKTMSKRARQRAASHAARMRWRKEKQA